MGGWRGGEEGEEGEGESERERERGRGGGRRWGREGVERRERGRS